MRSASSGSADRSAICVTFTLPHENAVELQNMARSCAGQLRELGVLAVQVANTTTVSLQSTTRNTLCQSAHHSGTHDHRQQTLNATRTNIAQYLGADIASFSAAVSRTGAAEIDMHNYSVSRPNVVPIVSISSGVTVNQSINMAAESSPHIVNLLQHDVVSSRSVCLSSCKPLSSASDVQRPRKRARRRTPAAAAEVSVPLSMYGTADCANSVYSFQHQSRFVDSSAGVSPVHNMPSAEQFKVPESRKRRGLSSRKTARSQQMPIPGQAPSSTLTNSFPAGFNECSKSDEIGMLHETGTYSTGDGFQRNGVSPYHRMPVMTAGWHTYGAHSVTPNSLYQSLPAAAQYPSEYRHPQFCFPGNADYSQVNANVSQMPVVGSCRNFTPPSSMVFVSDADNQMYMKEGQVQSVLPKPTLRWSPASESQSVSVPYRSSADSSVPCTRRLHDVTHSGLPASHVMQRQFIASHSNVLPASDCSKPSVGPVGSASEKMVQLSISSDIHRIKNMSVSDIPRTSSPTGACVNIPSSSVTCQRVNGLFADVHSSAFAFHEQASHIKMNGDVDCLQNANSQVPSKCETVSENTSPVTPLTYAPFVSSVPSSVADTDCVLERQLKQPSVQLPARVQQCCLTNLEDAGVNGCSASTAPHTSKSSLSSGTFVCCELYIV